MRTLNYYFDSIRVKVREKLNPILGPLRRKRLNNRDFTIISNNCWAGHVYRYFAMPYESPTIGLYFYSEDYIKFCKRIRYYCSIPITFIDVEQSKWKEDLIAHHNENKPIGLLDDVEIVFLHYKTREEAAEKWTRRTKRICWENLYFKMSEQNLCKIEMLKEFDELPYKNKFVFTSKDYGLKSQVVWRGNCQVGNIPIDTIQFRSFINPVKFLNGKEFRK